MMNLRRQHQNDNRMLKNTIIKNWEDSHIGKVRAMIAT
jgi:hypothetical protein